MKNILLKCLIALSMSLVFLGSCATSPFPEDEIEYKTQALTLSLLLFPDQLKGSPRMDFTINVIDLKRLEEEESDFFKTILYEGDSPSEYKDSLVEGFRNIYKDMQAGAAAYPEDIPADYSWDYQEDLDIRLFGEQGMVIARNKYAYTGGAHGMPSRQYYVIDLGELRALSLEDFFRDPESAELLALAKEELRSYAGLEAGQPLSEGVFFEDELKLSRDFFIGEEGISFHWDPYELAPYSEGHIEITLPWNRVRPLLLHEGMELLTGFGIYLFV